MAGINKAFNRPSRPNIITNNVNEVSASQSATQISSGGYTYYVYTTPTSDTYTPSGEYTKGSRTIKGGSVQLLVLHLEILIFLSSLESGGGGGGDGMGEGGGGGAGGVRYFPNVPVPNGTIAVKLEMGITFRIL